MASQELWEPYSHALPPLPPSQDDIWSDSLEEMQTTHSQAEQRRPNHLLRIYKANSQTRCARRRRGLRRLSNCIPRGSSVERRIRQLFRAAAEDVVREELEGNHVFLPVPHLDSRLPALTPPPSLRAPPKFCTDGAVEIPLTSSADLDKASELRNAAHAESLDTVSDQSALKMGTLADSTCEDGPSQGVLDDMDPYGHLFSQGSQENDNLEILFNQCGGQSQDFASQSTG